MEQWRDIKGYEDYQVSNYGRVKSKKRVVIRKDVKPMPVNECIRSLKTEKRGYITTSLRYDGGKLKTFYVHRLVAEVFVPNPDNKQQVNHKDGDKSNNHVSNLEWATAAENNLHARQNGLANWLSGEDSPNAVLTVDDVLDIRRLREQDKLKLKVIAEMYNVRESAISRIVNRKRWAHV